MVLDLHTDPEKLCLNYTDFSTLPIYQLSCHEIFIISNAIKENTKRYTENTLHRRKLEMVNARLRVQQFTHPVHPNINSSYRLSYLVRQFVDKTGKIRYTAQAKYNEREKRARQYTCKYFSFQKSNCVTKTCPYQIACAARLPKLSPLAASP